MTAKKVDSCRKSNVDYHRILRILGYLSINVLCIWLGFLLCVGTSQLGELNKMNGQVAHKFYFGLNAVCELDNILSCSSAEQKQLLNQIDGVCYIFELCDPYITFTEVYKDDLSPEETEVVRSYLNQIQVEVHNTVDDGILTNETKLFFEKASSRMSRALGSAQPLNTLYGIIKQEE